MAIMEEFGGQFTSKVTKFQPKRCFGHHGNHEDTSITVAIMNSSLLWQPLRFLVVSNYHFENLINENSLQVADSSAINGGSRASFGGEKSPEIFESDEFGGEEVLKFLKVMSFSLAHTPQNFQNFP